VAAQSGVRSVTGDGLGGQLLGVYVAFLVGWVAVTAVLLYAYRALASERPGTRALLWGASSTGSFVAGTSLGWVLFVSLDVPLGGSTAARTPWRWSPSPGSGCSCCTSWCWSATA
jgi:hypothetical protein